MKTEIFEKLRDKWLNVPWKAGGKDIHGVDCSFFVFNFLTDYIKEIKSSREIFLPESISNNYDSHFFLRNPSRKFSIIKEFCDSQVFMRLKDSLVFEMGDVLLFSQGGCEAAHVGIAMSDTHFLHSIISYGVVESKQTKSSEFKLRFVYEIDYDYLSKNS